MTNSTDTLNLLSLASQETRDRNDGLAHEDECVICHGSVKLTDKTWWVSCNGGMDAVRLDVEHDDDDMGCFPIGSSCVRKVPAEFRFRYGY